MFLIPEIPCGTGQEPSKKEETRPGPGAYYGLATRALSVEIQTSRKFLLSRRATVLHGPGTG